MGAETSTADVVATVLVAAVAAMDDGGSPASRAAARLTGPLRATSWWDVVLEVGSGTCRFVGHADSLDSDLLGRLLAADPFRHPLVGFWARGGRGVASLASLDTHDTWRLQGTSGLYRVATGGGDAAGLRLDGGVHDRADSQDVAAGSLHILAFAREEEFSPAELSLLRTLQPALRTLDRHTRCRTDRAGHADRAGADRAAGVLASLTGRETEVLLLLTEGLLASSIATRLSISERTVHRHLSSIYGKLGVHDRLGVALLARELGLQGAVGSRA